MPVVHFVNIIAYNYECIQLNCWRIYHQIHVDMWPQFWLSDTLYIVSQ